MNNRTCTFEGCGKQRRARGWCDTHYRRWAIHGSVADRPYVKKDPMVLFWRKVNKSAGCWYWTAAVSKVDGYGRFRLNGKTHLAHRVSFEYSNGAIPRGAHIDHRCHNRTCVNPGHLRTVTQKQNNENKSGAQSNSKSGVRGVHPIRNKASRYEAMVMHYGEKFHLGYFDDIGVAEAAVISKRLELFTHSDGR